MQTFLWLNIALLVIPLLFAFYPRAAFYKDLPYALPAMVLSTTFFLLWDYFFTVWGVWSWQQTKITGVQFFGLPAEVMLWYFSLSFMGIFIYFWAKRLIKKDMLEQVHKFISALFLLFTLTIFFTFSSKLYTSMAALICAFMLLCRMWIALPRSMGYFYKSFLFTLVPVLLFYMLLAGIPVITYSNEYITGVRLLEMPLENIMYFLALHLMNIGVYDFLKRKFGKSAVAKKAENSAEIQPNPPMTV